MQLEVLKRFDDVEPAEWNALAGEFPFLRHEFLSALQRHGCVGRDYGWIPYFLLLRDGPGGALVAAAPTFLKLNSFGEFVFDFAWADALERAGGSYYPKLVMGVPWTPATGPRILHAAEVDAASVRDALAHAGREIVEHEGLSSAHWLFPRLNDARCLEQAGYLVRHGCQYHWRNAGYPDFAAFLGALSSKKRKNIRRERQRLERAGIRIRTCHGHELDEASWVALHRYYVRTFRERGNVPVLSLDCLRALGAGLRWRMVAVLAELDGATIAGALCFRDNARLYGRYWGCDMELDSLHFETCYYQGIEYCIREGLSVFEPGAQGEHKVARGFLPTLTFSAHYLTHPGLRAAVADFLERERPAVQAYAHEMTANGPYRAEALARLMGSNDDAQHRMDITG